MGWNGCPILQVAQKAIMSISISCIFLQSPHQVDLNKPLDKLLWHSTTLETLILRNIPCNVRGFDVHLRLTDLCDRFDLWACPRVGSLHLAKPKKVAVHSWTGTMVDSESGSLCPQGRFKEAPHSSQSPSNRVLRQVLFMKHDLRFGLFCAGWAV